MLNRASLQRTATAAAICAAVTGALPTIALARSALAEAVTACTYNETLDQELLKAKLSAFSWRVVATPEAMQTLSYFGDLLALGAYESALPWDKVAITSNYYNALLQTDPGHDDLKMNAGTFFYTHPEFGATLLRTYGLPKRQFCRFALSAAAYDDEFLYQTRIAIQVSADRPSFTFEETKEADGISVLKYTMTAKVAPQIVEDGVSISGPAIGKVRMRQMAPDKTSRSKFTEIFKASAYLSVYFRPKRR